MQSIKKITYYEYRVKIKEITVYILHNELIGSGLWCLMPLSAIFQLYHGGGNRSTWGKPLTKIFTQCCIEYTLSEWDSNSTLVVIGTDCIGSSKSNYHMIMTTMTPNTSYMYRTYTIKSKMTLIVFQCQIILVFCKKIYQMTFTSFEKE